MKKIIFLLVIAIIFTSGCIQSPASMTCNEYCEQKSHVQCIGDWEISGSYPDCTCKYVCGGSETEEPLDAGSSTPEASSDEPQASSETVEASGPWCEPTDINIFSDIHIPVNDISIFVTDEYDKEFGPNAVDHVYLGDGAYGYLAITLPDRSKYSDLNIEGRFVNNKISGGAAYPQDDLIKYGDYYYQLWETDVSETGTLTFEAKITSLIRGGVERTQCESYSIPVEELEDVDVTSEFTFDPLLYSRSRIFIISGSFSETLYDKLNQDLQASIVSRNKEEPAIQKEVNFKLVNKVVCVSNICKFNGEFTLPQEESVGFSSYDYWCSSAFTRQFKLDRGLGQPFFADLTQVDKGIMCNKLKVGI
jgi:hypothetical protein